MMSEEMQRQFAECKRMFSEWEKKEQDKIDKRDAVRRALGPFMSMTRIIEQERRALAAKHWDYLQRNGM